MFRITKLKEIDLAKVHKQQSYGTLLDAIYETRSKLKNPRYATATTDIEMKSILDKCLEVYINRV